jgi:hypothetical protein
MNNETLILKYLRTHQMDTMPVHATGNCLKYWITDDDNLNSLYLAIASISTDYILIQIYLDRESVNNLGILDLYEGSGFFPGETPIAQKTWRWDEASLLDILHFLHKAPKI